MPSSPALFLALKRGLDLSVSALGLFLLSPLLAIVAIAIRLESRGPSFFRQVRVGRDFRRFEILKFRTMRIHAQETGPLVTSATDQRVTRLGRFLRRVKLDEMPQLWNVLRGDMSLVGPRPEVPHYVELFRADYAEVLRVRPGVTDLASLTFRDEEEVLASAADPETHYREHVLPAKIALNKDYVRRASFGFDIEVIAKTVLEATWLRVLPSRRWLFRHRSPIVIGLHLAMIVAASYGAFWLRFDGAIPATEIRLWSRTILLLLAIQIPILAFFRLYQGLWSYTSIHDLQNIVAAVVGSELIFFAVIRVWLGQAEYPRSVFILDAMLLIFLMGSARMAKRFYESSGQLRASRRALIIGAGDRADFVIRAMKSQMLGDYRPVGIITTWSDGTGRIHGVPVLGNLDSLDALAKASIADEIVLAYDRSDIHLDRRVVDALRQAGVPARDAFQLMVTVVNGTVPPESAMPQTDVVAAAHVKVADVTRS